MFGKCLKYLLVIASAIMLSLSCSNKSFAQLLPAGQSVVLDTRTISVIGEIDEASMADMVEQVIKSESQDVTIYFNSPGGSVLDGANAIAALRGTHKHIRCVAGTAISMAFVMFELACDDRFVTSSSITMQHQAAWGSSPKPMRNAASFNAFLLSLDS